MKLGADKISKRDRKVEKQEVQEKVEKTNIKPPVKSVMSDDAMLYEKDHDSAERIKERVHQMSTSQKLSYYIEYYGVKCLVIAVAVFFLVFVVINAIKKPNDAFYFMVTDSDNESPAVTNEDTDFFEPFLVENQIDPKKNIVSIDWQTYGGGSIVGAQYGIQTYQTKFIIGEVDLLISARPFYEEIAQTYYMDDIRKFVSEEVLEKYTDKFIYVTLEDSTQRVPVGIVLSGKDNKWLQSVGWFKGECVVGVAADCPHEELAIKMLEQILK